MDEEGAIIEIPNTIFPLYPEENKELRHIALIARGEKQYYLTLDLAADVGARSRTISGRMLRCRCGWGDGLLES